MGEKGFPLLTTDEVEIAWKILPANFGDKVAHFHKIGVEVNIVISGSYKALVDGKETGLKRGDFLVVYPETRLKNISAQEGTELIVVKAPSVTGDKFDIKNDYLVIKPVKTKKFLGENEKVANPKIALKDYLKILPGLRGTFGPELERENKQIRKKNRDFFLLLM